MADLAGLLDTWTRVDTLDTRSETRDAAAATRGGAAWWDSAVRFTAQDVVGRVNAAARELGLSEPDADFTTPTKIGRILTTLRIKAARTRTPQRTRGRAITRRAADQLLRAYAPAAPETTRAGDVRPAPPQEQVSRVSTSVQVSSGADPWADLAPAALTRRRAARRARG